VVLITLVHRWQGLILQKGNPKGIKDISDLVRPGVSFVNRQPDSGTRILLDYELKRRGIEPARVNGYRNEEYTHMNVAMAVASGRGTRAGDHGWEASTRSGFYAGHAVNA
jgi:putative molybdopterin biosynthesis protein